MVPLIVVWVMTAAALLAAAVVDQVRLRRNGYRRWCNAPVIGGDHLFDRDASASFRGGGAHASVMLSGPIVVLDADPEWIHLYGTGGMMEVWISRSRITGIKLIRLTTATAVRFIGAEGEYDGVLFFTFRPTALVDALRTHGWPAAPT
jgi:hypothetical protein